MTTTTAMMYEIAENEVTAALVIKRDAAEKVARLERELLVARSAYSMADAKVHEWARIADGLWAKLKDECDA